MEVTEAVRAFLVPTASALTSEQRSGNVFRVQGWRVRGWRVQRTGPGAGPARRRSTPDATQPPRYPALGGGSLRVTRSNSSVSGSPISRPNSVRPYVT
ncbi:hypothetical protein GCM10010349_62940 [Streptomyces flavofungini]|nr:hypothetical protein GCM10010349_62940 [Streptomyces flavofungini]